VGIWRLNKSIICWKDHWYSSIIRYADMSWNNHAMWKGGIFRLFGSDSGAYKHMHGYLQSSWYESSITEVNRTRKEDRTHTLEDGESRLICWKIKHRIWYRVEEEEKSRCAGTGSTHGEQKFEDFSWLLIYQITIVQCLTWGFYHFMIHDSIAKIERKKEPLKQNTRFHRCGVTSLDYSLQFNRWAWMDDLYNTHHRQHRQQCCSDSTKWFQIISCDNATDIDQNLTLAIRL